MMQNVSWSERGRTKITIQLEKTEIVSKCLGNLEQLIALHQYVDEHTAVGKPGI